jgi:hypothetical protein
VEGALTCVHATIWMQPRNPINGLLAPQGLVGLFAGYQSRPNCIGRIVLLGCGQAALAWCRCQPARMRTRPATPPTLTWVLSSSSSTNMDWGCTIVGVTGIWEMAAKVGGDGIREISNCRAKEIKVGNRDGRWAGESFSPGPLSWG